MLRSGHTHTRTHTSLAQTLIKAGAMTLFSIMLYWTGKFVDFTLLFCSEMSLCVKVWNMSFRTRRLLLVFDIFRLFYSLYLKLGATCISRLTRRPLEIGSSRYTMHTVLSPFMKTQAVDLFLPGTDPGGISERWSSQQTWVLASSWEADRRTLEFLAVCTSALIVGRGCSDVSPTKA